MNISTRLYSILSITLLAMPFSSNAESWSCRHDNDVREIHIERESSAAVPCSVVYKKLTEGVEDQVLWSANNDENYCDEKAQEFVAKQESWGWTCVETISDKSNGEETTPADETSNES